MSYEPSIIEKPALRPPADPYQTGNFDYDRAWWRESIVYQVYLQSFKDGNNDGIGDFVGLTSKIDYIKSLGIDVIWVSPYFKSPLKDQGYDIADYYSIKEEFGTDKDFENFVNAAHARSMRVLMDGVFNHTSNEHQWFKESKSSKDNPRRDWYIWRPAKTGETGKKVPPNNWRSLFGGCAWEWDDKTQEYYLHLFSRDQPDLNWDNPAVRRAIYGVMQHWLDRGVDGFRLDAINVISKDPNLPDAPIEEPDQPYQSAIQFFNNGPNIHKYLKEMHEYVLSKGDMFTVGEMPIYVSEQEASKYVAKERRELDMVFQFNHLIFDFTEGDKWTIRKWETPELEAVIRRWQQHMLGNHGWNAIFFENHDQPRSIVRWATDNSEYREVAAKMLATLLFSLRGTIFIYQGQELGMSHPQSWSIEDYQDVETINWYQEEYDKRKKENGGREPDMTSALKAIRLRSRDNARVVIPWDDNPNGGFCNSGVTPWIKPDEQYQTINVKKQDKNPESVLNYYRRLIFLRKCQVMMFYGGYTPLDSENKHVIAFLRTQGPFANMTLCNFSDQDTNFDVPPEVRLDFAVLLACNYDIVEPRVPKRIILRPYEARLYGIR
ncbi:putative alpha-glucosidase/alpha-amylase [Talaromyces proteolyticus]|uniref:Alpha-glucosidase/alpha-amylase n=1 Tax=Talaromyces proteolyticus TaxID=1131652 RepID=A0AAD4L4V1_9EURO|nr:putative alpha-glucosidase/alpha-amylase [Talaromyces proteolyticus]KAH8705076.1 putative alpha-glucosidase/alpha-amylase [Talaromyces proteolyticus]